MTTIHTNHNLDALGFRGYLRNLATPADFNDMNTQPLVDLGWRWVHPVTKQSKPYWYRVGEEGSMCDAADVSADTGLPVKRIERWERAAWDFARDDWGW